MRDSGASYSISEIIPLGTGFKGGRIFSCLISGQFVPDLSPGVWLR